MWELNEIGSPVWIASVRDAEWGRWSWIIPSAPMALQAGFDPVSPSVRFALNGGPASMPSVGKELMRRTRPDEPAHSTVGRPTVEHADPLVARWAAWLGDMRDISTWETARRLSPAAFEPRREHENDPLPNQRSARRPAERRIRAGRLILNKAGVFPWALWPGGDLPAGWWTTARFAGSLEAWYHTYVTALEPAITAAKETLRAGESVKVAQAVYLVTLRRLTMKASRSVLSSDLG
jgi:hypothetical protein